VSLHPITPRCGTHPSVTTPSTPSEASAAAPPELSPEVLPELSSESPLQTPPDPELDAAQEALEARQAELAAVRNAIRVTDQKIVGARRTMDRATQRLAEAEARKVEVEAEIRARRVELAAELEAELEAQEVALQAALVAQKALRKKSKLTAELRAEMEARMQATRQAERKAALETVLKAVRETPEEIRRRAGRPSKGERVAFHVKMPEEFRNDIEAMALDTGLPMGAIITRLVAIALNAATPDYCWPRSSKEQEAEWRAAVQREALADKESPLDKAS
jgi:hypothetical protein